MRGTTFEVIGPDEYSYVEEIGTCKVLSFPLTWKCNAKCVMCDIWKPYKTNDDFDLTLLDVLAASGMLATDLKTFALSGGEITALPPTTVAPVLELTHGFSALKTLLVNSNALLPGRLENLTRQLAREAKPCKIEMTLSLHGVGEVHDRIMGRSGAFQKLLESYDRLMDLQGEIPSLEVGINVVVQRGNADRLQELLDFAEGRGIPTYVNLPIWSDLWLENHRYYEDISLDDVAREQVMAALASEALTPANRWAIKSRLEPGPRLGRCGFKERGVFLTPEGGFYACGYTTTSYVGSLREEPFDELWLRSIEVRKRSKALNDVCRSCVGQCWEPPPPTP